MKAIRLLLCLAVGLLLMAGTNSCENKKKTVSESSKENTEKSRESENSENVSVEASDASVSTESANPKSEKLILIDFYATWCGPCKEMAPVVKKMEEKYGDKLEFRKVDIDKEPEMAQKYRIDAVPTFVILSAKGEEIDRMVGACSEDIMDETLWEIINYNTVK